MAGNSNNTSGRGRGGTEDREDVLRRAGIQRDIRVSDKADGTGKNTGSAQKTGNRSDADGRKPSGRGPQKKTYDSTPGKVKREQNEKKTAGGSASKNDGRQNPRAQKNGSRSGSHGKSSGSKNGQSTKKQQSGGDPRHNNTQKKTAPQSALSKKNSSAEHYTAGSGKNNSSAARNYELRSSGSGRSGQNTKSSAQNSTSKKRLAAVSPEVDVQQRKEMLAQAEQRKRDIERRKKDEEKINKARLMQKYRKLFTGLRYFAIFAVIVGLLVLLSVTVLFKVESITVERKGEVSYSDSEIVSMSDIKLDDSLFLSDTKKAQQRLKKELPFIGECTVKRKLPAKIVITVDSAHKLGIIDVSDGMTALIDDGGKVLRFVDPLEDMSKFVRLNGLEAQLAQPGEYMSFTEPEKLKTAALISNHLEKAGIKPDSIDFLQSTVSFMFDSRIKVKLGSSVGLKDKLELAAAIIREDAMQGYEKGILDMTIEGRGDFLPDYVVEKFGLDSDAKIPVTDITDIVSESDAPQTPTTYAPESDTTATAPASPTEGAVQPA